jgi:hypothetical protein
MAAARASALSRCVTAENYGFEFVDVPAGWTFLAVTDCPRS